MPYLGRQPGVGVRNRYIYTATASQTTFSGADDNGATLAYDDAAYVDVYLNGVLLIPVTDYAATTKTSIVLTSGAAADDLVEILAYEIASIADTVSKANGGTFDGAVTVNGTVTSDGLTVDGNLSVDGGTIKLDGNHPDGTGNVALGDTALDSVTTGGNYNTAVGTSALTANTTGNQNAAVGYEALLSNTTGYNNIAVGLYAGRSNTTGLDNVAVGTSALRNSTTASYSTSTGHQSSYNTTTGNYNVANGYQSLFSNTTSSFNTTVGTVAGYSTTGAQNTFLGYGAGYYVSTGSKNTIVGSYNGNQDSLDLRTLSNTIVLSDGDGRANLVIDSNGAILFGDTRSASGSGANTTPRFFMDARGSDRYLWSCAGGGSSNFYAQRTTTSGTGHFHYFLYNSTYVGGITTNGSSTTYATSSDYRLKDNVTELTGAIDRVKQVPVHRFNFVSNPETTVDGFLAHEVQDIVPESVTGTKDEVDADGNPVYQGIDQSKLVPLLTQALKDAITKIEALEARVSTLENT